MMLIWFQTVKLRLGVDLGDTVVVYLCSSLLEDPCVISACEDASRDQVFGHFLRKIVKFINLGEGDSWFLVSEAPIQTQMSK